MERKNKRIFFSIWLVAFVTVLFAFILLPYYGKTVYAEGETEIIDLDKTNVLDDLKSKKDFSLLEYPFYESEKPEIKVIDFVEYCYDYRAEQRDKYGLYVYVYNPNQQVILTESEKNTIQLAVQYDSEPVTEKSLATKYEKFNLKFCSMSTEDGTLRLFYKFKIIDHKSDDGKTIAERVNSNGRRYDISGIELLTDGNVNATDYPISTSYTFSGYAKGFGAEGADTGVELKRDTLETISLDLKSTTYRFPYINEHGAGHQNQLDSVYFAVPKKYEVYGDLLRVHCSWNEQKTSSIIVSTNQEVVDDVSAHLGTSGDDAAFSIYSDYQAATSGIPMNQASWGYNALASGHAAMCTTTLPYVGYAFKATTSDVRDYNVSSADMKKWLADHNNADYLFADSVDEGRTKGKQEYTFTADEAFDLLSFNSTASGWDKFCLNWQSFWTGKKWDFGGDNISVEPIRLVGESDFTKNATDNANALYVNSADYNDFKNYYDTNKVANNVFLLRFAVTDYYSNLQMVFGKGFFTGGESKSTYRAQETVFLDFDIIDLTFKNDTTETIIPVVASPIDIVGDITAPIVEDFYTELLQKILAVLLVVLLVVLVVALCSVITPIGAIIKAILKAIAWVISAILWVLTLPFRLLAKLFKRR